MDGILGKEALVILTTFSQLMEEKLEEPISRVRSWVKVRIVISVTRPYSCMIQGDFLTSPLRDWEPNWDKGLGLGLVQSISRENNSAHTITNCFETNVRLTSPLVRTFHARCHLLQTIHSILVPNHVLTDTAEDEKREIGGKNRDSNV